MKASNILVIYFLTLIVSVGNATCMSSIILCKSNVKLSNEYRIQRTHCAPPGGPGWTKEDYTISNPLFGKIKFDQVSGEMQITRVSDKINLRLNYNSLDGATNLSFDGELSGYICENHHL